MLRNFLMQSILIEIMFIRFCFVVALDPRFSCLASWDAIEPGLVTESLTLRTELTDVTLVSEDVDFTDETLAIDDSHGDDVRGGDWGAGHGGWQGGRWGDRHGSWQGGWHENTYLIEVILEIGDWVKIPLEDFSGETLLIGDTYGDDVRGVDWGAGHGG